MATTATLKPLNPKDYLKVTQIRNLDEVEKVLRPWLYLNHEIGWDIETTPEKEFFNRKVRTIQFGTRNEQYVIDLLDFAPTPADLEAVQGDFGVNVHKTSKLWWLTKLLSEFLCSKTWLKIGVNLGFEYATMYWCFGLSSFGFYDCGMVERVRVAGMWPLADFTYFSMEEMMARYYGVVVNKELQTSFTIDMPLTQEQIEYAALDTRLPLAIRYRQLNGYTDAENNWIAGVMEEGLWRTCEIENNCIGSFEQMHVHGEKIDVEKWKTRVLEITQKCEAVMTKLDELFIPIVGSKKDVITEEELDEAEAKWKESRAEFGTKHAATVHLKEVFYKLRKQRNEQQQLLKDLADKPMVGNAMINFDSPEKLKNLLKEHFPGLSGLESTDDDVLKNYAGIPVIDALREYREYIKQITTYGMAWVQEWTTRPCNEEGWLSPYTHKLHPRYNQLMAETGRSSSDRPNGQNLPRETDVRHCFIAEEGMVYVTCDMSGAELRIIAELANAMTWIEAFANNEDLHSVGCEILFPTEWPAEAEPNCAYYAPGPNGKPAHKKCKCEKHKKRREITKAINFFLAYGGVASTLAERIETTLEEAEEIMKNHESKFPDIWVYLEKSGKQAVKFFKSFDMFGRRRLFKKPEYEEAKAYFLKKWKKSLALPKPQADKNIQDWMLKNNSKKRPTGEIRFQLTHRQPTDYEIERAMRATLRRIERQGKNHCIQSTNASIIKLAMGCGHSPKGMPYLFHTLPLLKARLVGMIHDELKIVCPKENADRVAKLIGIAFKTAAAEVMHKVIMEFEYKIAPYWDK